MRPWKPRKSRAEMSTNTCVEMFDLTQIDPFAPGATIAVLVVALSGTTFSVDTPGAAPHGYATTKPTPRGDAAVTLTTTAAADTACPGWPTTGTTRSVPPGSRSPTRVSASRTGVETSSAEAAGKYPKAST